MNPDPRPSELPTENQPVGQFTLFHVLAVCGTVAGAILGCTLGLRYGVVGGLVGLVVGVPIGYYAGFVGPALFFFGLYSLLYPRDPDLGIISTLKSGLSKIQRHRKK